MHILTLDGSHARDTCRRVCRLPLRIAIGAHTEYRVRIYDLGGLEAFVVVRVKKVVYPPVGGAGRSPAARTVYCVCESRRSRDMRAIALSVLPVSYFSESKPKLPRAALKVRGGAVDAAALPPTGSRVVYG